MNHIVSKNVYQQMRLFVISFTPKLFKFVEELKQRLDYPLDQVDNVLLHVNTFNKTTTFNEASNSNNQADRVKWREAVNMEFTDIYDKRFEG
jgi:hypothetical protein